jgi:hypothetical protein
MIRTARVTHTLSNKTVIQVEKCHNICAVLTKGKVTMMCKKLGEVYTEENFYCKIECK